jgi:hypothetical protein
MDNDGIVDPLFAFAFLQSFVEILQEYFGTVSAATLKDNFDVVYQVSPTIIYFLSYLQITTTICAHLHSFSKRPSTQAATR